MDEKVLHEAVENITLIKSVIDRTKKSFVAFSRIFIYWGILFILNSIITFLMIMNKEQMLDISIKYPILIYVPPITIIALVAALIYRHISKKIPLLGLEKHLMKVWILILAMNVIPTKMSISTASTAMDMKAITIQANNFSVMFFSLAIALIVTSLFTGYKQLKYIAGTYIGISILYAFFNLPILSDTITQFLYLLALPFTFLYTGFFLKFQQARGN